MTFEQTAAWWGALVPDGSGRRNADLGGTELSNVYGGVSLKGWGCRRRRGNELYGDKVSFPTLQSGVHVAHVPVSRAIGDDPPPPPTPPEPPLTPEERIERDKRLQRWKGRALEAEAVARAHTKAAILNEAVLDEVRESLTAFRRPKIHTPQLHPGSTSLDAILSWSDGHAGEVVDIEVMQGLNRYSPAIYCRRMQATVDATLSLLFEHHQGASFERLYVFDLGDSVTGDALDDNKATNAMGVFASFAFSASVKAMALTELSAYLPVVYVAVPGNHGRRGPKMPWKQPDETADWLIAEMVRLHVRENDRIECVIPRAWSAVVNVRGHNHFLNHGYAAAKGGAGGIPWYAYMRRDGKMTAIESGQGERIHCRWYGHIHTAAEIPKMGGSGRQFIVGSLMGGNEYALNELGEYSGPEQLLVGASEKRKSGVSFRYPLEVDEADDKPSRYECLLP